MNLGSLPPFLTCRVSSPPPPITWFTLTPSLPTLYMKSPLCYLPHFLNLNSIHSLDPPAFDFFLSWIKPEHHCLAYLYSYLVISFWEHLVWNQLLVKKTSFPQYENGKIIIYQAQSGSELFITTLQTKLRNVIGFVLGTYCACAGHVTKSNPIQNK